MPNDVWDTTKASFDHGYQSMLQGLPMEVPEGHDPDIWKMGYGTAQMNMDRLTKGRKDGGRVPNKPAKKRLDRRRK